MTGAPSKTEQQAQPLVTIVMPCYRMGKLIGTALNSIAGQSYRNWELIAVDDCGPEDGTVESLEAFRTLHGDAKVKLIRHGVNCGVSSARNTAIGLASGSLIAFLDPDDYWAPTFLDEYVLRFLGNPEVDVVAGPVIITVNGSDLRGPVMGISSFEARNFPHCLSIGNCIQPSAAVVRAHAMRRSSGFTEEASLQHVEDWDLWIRLSMSGAKFEFVEKPLCYYRRHYESATFDAEKTNRLIGTLIGQHRKWFDVQQLHFLKALSYEVVELRDRVERMDRPIIRALLKVDVLISRLARCMQRGER